MKTNVNIDPVTFSPIVQTPSAASPVRAFLAIKATVFIVKVSEQRNMNTPSTVVANLVCCSADIDECQDPNIAQRCVENAECCNLPAHFVCKCKPGFEGDGEERCAGKSNGWNYLLTATISTNPTARFLHRYQRMLGSASVWPERGMRQPARQLHLPVQGGLLRRSVQRVRRCG